MGRKPQKWGIPFYGSPGIWDHMEPYGTRKDKTDYIGMYWTIRDHTGLYRAILDQTGPYSSIREHTKPYVTIHDHMGLYGAIRDHTVPNRSK